MDGNRLKVARNAAGFSLRDLAERIANRVSAQAIGKYERSEMVPSSDVLIMLAKALGVSENYLLSADILEFTKVDFRKKAVTSARDAATLSAKVISEVERYFILEEILQLDPGNWQKPSCGSYVVRNFEDAETTAQKLRNEWNLGSDAVPNLAEFLEEQGIKIIATSLPESVSGLLCWVRRNGGQDVPVIILNRNERGERQRFSLAHELGHLVMSVQGIDEEKACNRFAGAFLMAADVLRREVGKSRQSIPMGELFKLKKIFNVSVMAIAYRCKDLGIINRSAMSELFEIFDRHGWRRPPYNEPEQVPPEIPQRFHRLCMRALAEETVSEARAAELLEMKVVDLHRMMDGPVAT